MKTTLATALAALMLSSGAAAAGSILPCTDKHTAWPHLPKSMCGAGTGGDRVKTSTRTEHALRGR